MIQRKRKNEGIGEMSDEETKTGIRLMISWNVYGKEK